MLIQLLNFITYKFFLIWLWFCQVLGLILIKFDNKKHRFVMKSYAKLQCALMGIVTTGLYPLGIYHFIQKLEDTNISFTVNISLINETCGYIYMIYAFYRQFMNRHEILKLVNSTLEFIEFYTLDFPQFSQYKFLVKYKLMFMISVLIKIVTLWATIVKIMYVPDPGQFKIIIFALSIPNIVDFVIFNQFILGIITIQLLIKVVDLKLNNLIRRHHCCQRLYDNPQALKMLSVNLEISDELDKLSKVHQTLHHFHRKLCELYEFQMLISFAFNFVVLMLNCFYIFLVCLLKISNIKGPGNVTVLAFLNSFSIVINLMDIIFHLTVCSNCSEFVSKSNKTNKTDVKYFIIFKLDFRITTSIKSLHN